MRARHIPVRTCVACRTAGDKRGLMRVVRQPDGAVVWDRTGKLNGRGAYLCHNPVCIAAARKQKRLDKGLKVAVPPEVFDEMLAETARGEKEGE